MDGPGTRFDDQVDSLDRSVRALMGRLRSADAACTALADEDVSLTEGKAIEALGDGGACIMSDLAGRLAVALSTATGLVDKLVRKGLVARERDEADRRLVRAALTGRGRGLYETIVGVRLGFFRSMLAALDETERATFLALMSKIGRGDAPHKDGGS